MGDEEKSTLFIRADNHANQQAAIDHSIQKAKQIIQKPDDYMFDRANV